MFIFTQVQLSGSISPSKCATNFVLASLCTAAVAELAYQNKLKPLQHIGSYRYNYFNVVNTLLPV